MSVYFVQPVDGGPVKIGFSSNVPSRIRTLEKHYGVSLALLATFPGGRKEEKQIHDRFAHIRLGGRRNRGARIEQFQPAPELMAFIGRPLLVSPNPDAVEAMASTSNMVNIKIEADAYDLARVAAAMRGVSVSTYLTDLLRREAPKTIRENALRVMAEFGPKEAV